MITINLPNFITQAFVDQLMILIYLTIVDVVWGTILAVVRKEFDWAKLGGFFKTDGLPIIGWIVVQALLAIPGNMVPDGVLTGIGYGAYVVAFATIAASILGNLGSTGVLTKQINAVGIRHQPKQPDKAG